MLQIKNLSLYLIQDDRGIIEDFNFSLNRKDKVALIGEEGNGKSMLLKTIYDENSVKDICKIKGSIFKSNETIGYLPQIIDKCVLTKTTSEYLNSQIPIEVFDYSKYYTLLNEFDFNEDLINDDNYIANLSGGEKIKFYLLVEMMKDPTILLLDEPSNDLDLDSVKWLENFMIRLDIPLIFVSHDTKLLSNVANKIIHIEQLMRRSEPHYTISSTGYDVYVSKREEYIITQNKKSNKDREEFDKKMQRYRKVHDSVETYLKATNSRDYITGKRLKDKMHTVKSMGKRLEKEEANLSKAPDYEEPILIDFDDNIEIANSKTILDYKLNELKVGDKLLSKNISLKIIGAEKICIVGKNGAGKTTLIKNIEEELKRNNLKVGYMPQDYDVNYDINAIEFLSNDFSLEEHTKISTYLGSLNFKREEMYRKISDLSGGQKAKLFFAKMNLNKSEILILDEPTRNLSPLSQKEVISALKNFKGAIISVSHDRNFIESVCDKIYELNENGLSVVNK